MNTWRQHQLGHSKPLPLFNNQFFHPIFTNDNGYRVAFFDKFSRITEQHEIGNPHPGVTRRWPHGPTFGGNGHFKDSACPFVDQVGFEFFEEKRHGLLFIQNLEAKIKHGPGCSCTNGNNFDTQVLKNTMLVNSGLLSCGNWCYGVHLDRSIAYRLTTADQQRDSAATNKSAHKSREESMAL